jgi:hypothetical protein
VARGKGRLKRLTARVTNQSDTAGRVQRGMTCTSRPSRTSLSLSIRIGELLLEATAAGDFLFLAG